MRTHSQDYGPLVMVGHLLNTQNSLESLIQNLRQCFLSAIVIYYWRNSEEREIGMRHKEKEMREKGEGKMREHEEGGGE